MKLLNNLSVLWLVLLCGCMTCFDRKVEHAHADYLKFRAAHIEDYGQKALDHDWQVEYWWKLFLEHKAERGKPLTPGRPELEPASGKWAKFDGHCVLEEIESIKIAHDNRELT